jgi:tetratricopeptide (TPR) repeat protein
VPQEPLAVKGKADPVQTYVVERARPRAFRKASRGVEGIETPMVGREAELKHLQDAFCMVVEEGQCQVVTIVGEAGVGKSRLLYEFDLWFELQLETFYCYRGRVGKEMQNVPYALLRDLFSFHFEIQESDSAAVARDKLVQGIAAGYQVAEPGTQAKVEMKAHIVGQLLGLDFSDSRHVQVIGEDTQQLRDRAVIYIGEYFRALAAQHPVLMLLEDLHWADGSSLHAVSRLASSLWLGAAEASPLLIVCSARPSLYERRPNWGEGRSFHSRLGLNPLSKRDSRHLVEEILQRMEEVPSLLRDLVVGGAEGNPFFLEELIKMLIEEGVIRKGETAWSVEPERLSDLQVPPTLTGVLQARLDRLPFDERVVLQQASVVGRLFWDLAVAHIAAVAETEPDSEEVAGALAALQGREMVFPRATSAFQGTHEYLFKHAMLREVTYEGVLKRMRRVYHGLVAEWLVGQSGERAGEFTGLLADHLALAGRTEEAVAYLRQAAEQAAAGYANEEAASYYSRALEMTPADNAEECYPLLLAREALYNLLGAREEQARDLAALEVLAGALDDAHPPQDRVRGAEVALRRANYERLTGDFGASITAAQAAVVLAGAAQDLGREADGHRVWGSALLAQREYDAAQQQLEQALALARESGARRVEADSLSELGWVHWLCGIDTKDMERALFEQALHLYRETGDRRGEADALYNLGGIRAGLGDLPAARAYYEHAQGIHCEIGNRSGEADPLFGLAWVYWGEDDYAGARACLEQALAINREVGRRSDEAQVQSKIGETLGAQGYYAQGEARFGQALGIFRETGQRGPEGATLSNLGLICYYQGDYAGARALLEEARPLSRDFAARWAQSKGMAVLSLVFHAQGDHGAAREHAQQALRNGPEAYHLGQGDSALVLGHALAGLGDGAGATAAYGQALDRYRKSGFCNPPMEALAGLARLELARGEPAQALDHVEEILDHLKTHTLDGTYQPFSVYLTCYQVLQANDDARAGGVLRTAYRLLQERAVRIDDERLRRSFLEKVPSHRELVQKAERAGPGG